MDKYTVTVGQLALSDPQQVYEQIDKTLAENPETELYVFPEFATQHQVDLEAIDYLRGNPEAKETARKWIALVPDFARVQALAQEVGKAVLVGCIAQEKGQLYSRAYFYDPQAQQLASYDKTHVHWTENFLRPGAVLEPIQTRFGTLGILICYDMAFVEPTRVLGLKGAELLCALSAIPLHFHQKYPHYRMTGAAIFNQVYVVAANLGYTLQAPMGGASGIYSPEGDRIAQLPGTEFGTLSATIDLGLVRLWREKEQIGPYRQPHLYGSITAPLQP
jgi:predicted amidohydrolase